MHPSSTLPSKEDDMGRIVTPVLIENNLDVEKARAGEIPPEAIRRVEVPDALVDTGASYLCLPTSLIRALGLRPFMLKNSRTAAGPRVVTVFSAVLLSIQDRNAVVRVAEVPDGSPVLVGQLPLEEMDFILFPEQHKLVPNPAHGGEWTLEMY